ncbi:MAG: acyltransferase [Bacteroidia bacterium]|nr:acyltransferase [Bacteroidia bacterium]
MRELNVPNLRWIDVVLGLSVLGIMIFHLAQGLNSNEWMIPLGLEGKHLGGLFFLLIGFGLTTDYLEKEQDKIAPKEFLEKKVFNLYPLYFLIFLMFLGIFQFFYKSEFELVSNGSTFFRLWGFGFTDETFAYLNPSWWVFWPILQFYLIFPWFYWLFKKTSTPIFLLISLVIVLVSKYLGSEGVMFTESIFYWEQGLFIGPRMMEFSLGMILAKFFYSNESPILRPIYIFLGSVGIYAMGIFSLKVPFLGMLAGTFKAVAGLGLFYSLFIFFDRYDFTKKTINKGLGWIGRFSYAILLVHFVPFEGLMETFPDQKLLVGLIGVGCLLFSLPLGFLVDKLSGKILLGIHHLRKKGWVYILLSAMSVFLLTSIFLLDLSESPIWLEQLVNYVMLLEAMAILFIWYKSANRSLMVDFLCFSAIFSSFDFIFGVGPSKAVLALVFGILFVVIAIHTLMFSSWFKQKTSKSH